MYALEMGSALNKKLPRVFIVDDEHLIAETLAIILQKNGFTAACFTNPKEALEKSLNDPPDLLLSDVMMPALSGVDLAIAIRKAHPACRILLFSGHAGTGDLMSRVRAEGHDFHLLSKPLHPADLLRLIREQDPSWAMEAV
jgi:DNA-binding NtrC family response regulator